MATEKDNSTINNKAALSNSKAAKIEIAGNKAAVVGPFFHFVTLGKYFFVLILSVLSIAAIMQNRGVYDIADASRYIASGVAFLSYGGDLPKGVPYDPDSISNAIGTTEKAYPSKIFQVVTALSSSLIFNVPPQFSNAAIPSFFVFFLANILIFRMCARIAGTAYAVFVISLLTLVPFFEIYPLTMIRPLTDCWLVLFTILSFDLAVRGFYARSSVFYALGFLFRAQAIIFLPAYLTILNFKKKRFFDFFLPFILIVVILNVIFYALSNQHAALGISFYTKHIGRIHISDCFHIGDTISYLLSTKRLHVVLVLFLMNFIGACDSRTSKYLKKINIFSSALFICLFFLSANILLSLSITPDPRYFVYIIPISTVGAFCYFLFLFQNLQIQNILLSGKRLPIFIFAIILFFTVIYLPRYNVPIICTQFKKSDSDYAFLSMNIAASDFIAVTDYRILSRLYFTHRNRNFISLKKIDLFMNGKINDNIDWIAIGGPPHSSKWLNYLEGKNSFCDLSGNCYVLVAEKKDYYRIFKRANEQGLSMGDYMVMNTIPSN